jgi:hypothetical protein
MLFAHTPTVQVNFTMRTFANQALIGCLQMLRITMGVKNFNF